MNRDEHIQELIWYLKGMSICMCPESQHYWEAHAEEVLDALKGQENERLKKELCLERSYRDEPAVPTIGDVHNMGAW